MGRAFVAIGAVYGLGAVIAGAAGAHLAVTDPDAWRTATHFLLFHALVLVTMGLVRAVARAQHAVAIVGHPAFALAGALFAAGSLLFSGSIFLGEAGAVGATPLAPYGGGGLMLAWLSLFAAAVWPGRRNMGG
jgi:uncharacterized membrane protein YgdD (TMEM256/DUF423 family)